MSVFSLMYEIIKRLLIQDIVIVKYYFRPFESFLLKSVGVRSRPVTRTIVYVKKRGQIVRRLLIDVVIMFI